MEESKPPKIVKPDAMMTILLDEIAGRLGDLTETQQKILRHMEETTPEGVDVPLPTQAITETTFIDLIKDYPYRTLRSVDFFNKGPNTAYIRINEDAKEIPIEDRENIEIERPKATIRHITLRVAAGQSTTLTLLGHY